MGGRLGFFLIALFGVGVSVVRSVFVFGLEIWFLFYNSLWRLFWRMFCTRWYVACESLPREDRAELRERPGSGRKGQIWKDWEEKASAKRKCIETKKGVSPLPKRPRIRDPREKEEEVEVHVTYCQPGPTLVPVARGWVPMPPRP